MSFYPEIVICHSSAGLPVALMAGRNHSYLLARCRRYSACPGRLVFLIIMKGVIMLKAKDHIDRLAVFILILQNSANHNDKKNLIEELREFRSYTSWLIGELEKERCQFS